MSKTASCPSCGAAVVFRASASVYAVCQFCRSTLVRQDQDLANLGRMADLLEDNSLIQLGTEGEHRGLHFAVVGRIQLKYASGFWNEWHILQDDGRSAWLSEAGGNYTVSFLQHAPEPVPEFGALQPGLPVSLWGREFAVTDLETARCIAGEGELPFKVDAGYDVNAADLREGDHFATIDYSESPPLVFAGEAVTFAALKLANLRGQAPFMGEAGLKVKTFACPKCAAPLTIHSEKIEVVACASCGSIVDAADPNYRILAEAGRAARVDPRIPLGSKGALQEVEWEVIGFMRRQSVIESVTYPWSEYLLHEPKAGFAWLIESNGHWNFARTVSSNPVHVAGGSGTDVALGKDQRFKLYSGAAAQVSYVVGEFYWRVEVGEEVQVADYVAPPRLLSEERSEREIVWSLAEYLEPEQVWQAFKLKSAMPPRIGICANQPNPHAEAFWRAWGLFWKMSLAALAIQFVFMLFSAGAQVYRDTLNFQAGDNETIDTKPFKLDKPVRDLVVSNRTDLSQNWVTLSLALIEQDTGETRVATRDLSYYSGWDGNEQWSEGAQDDKVHFGPLPAGTYYLAVDAETARGSPRVTSQLEIKRNPTNWANWILLQIVLALFPLLALWRRNAFETRRWADSDVAPAAGAASGDSTDSDN